MTLLRVHVRATAVSAVVVAAGRTAGGIVGGSSTALDGEARPDGTTRVAGSAIWEAVLTAAGDAVADLADPPTGLAISAAPDSLVVWDEETLGCARPVVLSVPDLAAAVAALASDEPHTWSHLRSGRYVLGDVASYVVARLTRGIHHVAAGDWAAPGLLGTGLPSEALPAPAGAGPIGVSDPATFLGLALPFTLVAGPR